MGLLSEVNLNAMTIVTSIPASSDTRPPGRAGSVSDVGNMVGVAAGTNADTGVGVAAAVTLVLMVVVLPAAEPSVA